MKSYDKNKPLISIHIPKCAGASFSKVLKSWFGDNFYRHYYDERLNRMPDKYRLTKKWRYWKYRKGICVHGHFNNERKFGVSHYYPDADQFITILRDPFEMHLSYYFYIKKLGIDAFRNGMVMEAAIDDSYDLKKYLSESKCNLLQYFPFTFTLDNYREILSNHFIYIGVTEFLQTSVNILAKKIGLSPVDVSYLNVSERQGKVPDSAREIFEQKHKLEYAIYEYALTNYKNV
jgi:hypothetical protein